LRLSLTAVIVFVQVDEISASMVDGMLTITWPRVSAAEHARSIEVD
jgi:HSP20 family molecular chaperone IbpA